MKTQRPIVHRMTSIVVLKFRPRTSAAAAWPAGSIRSRITASAKPSDLSRYERAAR